MEIFNIVFPIFSIAIIGYLLAYFEFFKQQEIAGIARFVFTVAIPLMLFNSMANITLPETIEWGFLLSYYLAAFVMYGLGIFLGRTQFSYTLTEQGIFGLACGYSNSVLIGIPVTISAFGDEGQLPLFLLISIHSALMFFTVTLIAETGGAGESDYLSIAWLSLKKIIANPIVLGLMLGLLTNWLALELPEAIDNTIAWIARAALPCALFVLGASLSRYQLAGQFTQAGTIISLKMLLHPLLVAFFAFYVFQVEYIWGAVAVLIAAMPIGINSYVFAEKYQACIAPLATSILLSTMLSMGSLSVVLSLLL